MEVETGRAAGAAGAADAVDARVMPSWLPRDGAALSNAALRLIAAARGAAPAETCFSEPPDEEQDADVIVLDGLLELLQRREEVAELRRTLEQLRRLVGVPEPYNLVSVLQVRLRLGSRLGR
jgi:hypothetical protein